MNGLDTRSVSIGRDCTEASIKRVKTKRDNDQSFIVDQKGREKWEKEIPANKK
jgi:hypothetical protein